MLRVNLIAVGRLFDIVICPVAVHKKIPEQNNNGGNGFGNIVSQFTNEAGEERGQEP